jgi:hypothetical protein
MVGVQPVQQHAAGAIAGQAGLVLGRHHEGERRRPGIAHGAAHLLPMQMQMAGGDQSQRRVVQQRRQGRAGGGRHRPVVEDRVLRRGHEDRLVQEQGEAPVTKVSGGRGDEGVLRRFLRQAGAHDLGVEPNQPPARHIPQPAILADHGPEPGDPHRIHRLARHGAGMAADIMIARDRQQRRRQGAQQAGGEFQILRLVGAIQREVAAGDYQIGRRGRGPGGDHRQIVAEQRAARREMGIRNLQDNRHAAPRFLGPGARLAAATVPRL